MPKKCARVKQHLIPSPSHSSPTGKQMSLTTPGKTPSPRRRRLFKCGNLNCLELGIECDTVCCMCGIALHTFCLQDVQRSLEVVNPDEVQVYSISCFHYSTVPEVAPVNESQELIKENKESLKRRLERCMIKSGELF